MYACVHEIGRRFFEGVCAPSNATTHSCDPPPPRNTKEPEPRQWDSGRSRSRQEFVNVVVVAILNAGVDTATPRGPEAVADPALAEGCHARGRPIQGITGVESIRVIEVLNLDGVAASGYPREYVLVLTDGGEG